MKRFLKYLKEDFDTAIYNSDGKISIDDPSVVDAINANLDLSTARSFVTPYIALEEVRKILAYYKIFIPKSAYLDQNHGNDVFEISQFGDKMGVNDQGEVITKSASPLFFYFEWSLNRKGMYDVFCSIVDNNDLEEIMADYEAEIEDDQTDLEESVMPNLKKKMSIKKVTLPNMMKKEEAEQLDELHGKSKEAIKAIKKRIEKKHDDEWEATREKRKREKLAGSEKTKKEDKSRNDLAKRWLRADRAEKKLSK